MEFTPKPFEANEPGQTGEAKTSKKRKKKTTRVPLPVAKAELNKEKPEKKEEANEPVKKQRTKLKRAKPDEQRPEAPEASVPAPPAAEAVENPSEDAADKAELFLPEVPSEKDKATEGEDFQGELIIDHTAEAAASVSETPPKESPEPRPRAAAEPAESRPAATAEDSTRADASETEPAAEALPPVTAEPEPEPALRDLGPEPPRVAPPLPLMMPWRREDELRMLRAAEPAASERLQPVEPQVSQTEANRQAYRAEKRGLSRGVVSGGLVGWLAGRRGRRAAEREANAAIRQRDSRIQQLEAEAREQRVQTERQANIVARTRQELRELMHRTWENQILKRPAPEAPAPSIERPVYKAPEAIRPAETRETPKPPIPERAPVKKPEAAPKPEEQPITEETYLAPEGRRFEASAWHRIEVDEVTGRAVERPSFEYGEAFKREQQQEKLASDAAKAQTAAQVGMTLLADAATNTASSAQAKVPETPAPARPAASPQDMRREALAAVRQVVQGTLNPLTWAAALIICVLLYLAGFFS